MEEYFSRTKRNRDKIIYSMLRCKSRPRLEELSLSIREGELDFATAAIRFSEGPESAQGGRVGPISPDIGHPELKTRLANANEGDLIGPFAIGEVHVLLRLDTRITTRLDASLQDQMLQELYNMWLDRQLSRLEVETVLNRRSTFQLYDFFRILKLRLLLIPRRSATSTPSFSLSMKTPLQLAAGHWS